MWLLWEWEALGNVKADTGILLSEHTITHRKSCIKSAVLRRYPEVLHAFSDGVAWLSLSQKPDVSLIISL